ncbi:MAG: hypothetical protein ACT4NU_03845 [Chromatiales bacterium]
MTLLEEAALVALLQRRFGDGTVYLQSREDRLLLKKAVQLGLVTHDGYLTPAGQRYVTTHKLDQPEDSNTADAAHRRDELLGEI